MYLINCDGSYRLESHYSPTGVRYLILSHTWGDDGDEVSYQDMGNPKMARRKKGFGKIKEICARARRNGIPYAWVDTCCIDKSSSTELSESINSMYDWYQRAVCCVAYLEDLRAGSDEAPENQLRLCRWFTRGWTLQELIAPGSVLFVDERWNERGTRRSLSPVLSRITGISTAVLDGTRPLHNVAVAQRMSWAARRLTTRVEDIAYCLLGIFDINMPLLYGEGQKAFVRLQQAVLQQTGDLSVFAWDVSRPDDRGLDTAASHESRIAYIEAAPFALHPACFRSCEMVERFTGNVLPSPAITITSAGVRFFACITTAADGEGSGGGNGLQLLHLQCKVAPDPAKQDAYVTLAIPLGQVPDGYMRWADAFCPVSPSHSLGLGGSGSRQVLTEICLVSGAHLRSILSASRGGRPATCVVKWDPDVPDVASSYYPQHLWDPGSCSFYAEWSDVFLGAIEVRVASNDASRNAAEGSAGGSKFWVLCGMARTAAVAAAEPRNDHRHGKRKAGDRGVVSSDDGTGWEFWAAILQELQDGTLPSLAQGFQATRLRNPYTLADVSLALRTELRGVHATFPRTCTVPYGAGASIAFTVSATTDTDSSREVRISATL
ncbi:hypothetical protein RB597_008296 [Gaeumannomyces tritici]